VLPSEDPLTITEVIDQLQPVARKVDSILTDISALTGTLTGKRRAGSASDPESRQHSREDRPERPRSVSW
jgi:hypothetical protein